MALELATLSLSLSFLLSIVLCVSKLPIQAYQSSFWDTFPALTQRT